MTPRFLSSWRLDVTTIGPVHIGCGAEMDPTNYVLDAASDTLFEFAPDALTAILDERNREVLLRLVSGNVNQHTIPRVQKLIHDRRAALITHAARAVRASSGVGKLYKQRIGSIAQSETGAINQLEIEKSFNDPVTGMPILPGSSLKGAVRTALLNRINAGKEGRGGERSLELQQRLFEYRSFEADPMRLVHIADAMWTEGKESDDLTAETVVTFAVNRKKNRIMKDGKEAQSQARQKGLYQILEVIPAFRRRALRSQLALHRIDIDHEKRPKLHWSVPEIAEACNGFYLRDFEDEREALRDRGLLDESWDGNVRNLMDGGMRRLLESNRAFLLRVGRHSGAESLTLDGVRKIRIMKGQRKSDDRKESTTWWLASDETDAATGMQPFGWVLVECTEDDRASDSWLDSSETSALLEVGVREWRHKVRARRRDLRKDWEDQAARQASRERQREAEEEKRREQGTRVATMTEEERALHGLRSLLAESRGRNEQERGGPLWEKTVHILSTAGVWPELSRREAADLAEEVFRFTGFPKGEKGRETKTTDFIPSRRQTIVVTRNTS